MQQWRLEIPPCPPAAVARLRSELSISAALAQVLVRRGLEEPARDRRGRAWWDLQAPLLHRRLSVRAR